MGEAVLWIVFLGILLLLWVLIKTGEFGAIFWLFVVPIGGLYLLYLIHGWSDLGFEIGFLLYLLTVPYVAPAMAFR